MKKVLLIGICAVFLAAIAAPSHAFLFLGGGGGGKGQRTHVDMGTVGQFDFHHFQNGGTNSNLNDENLRHYLEGGNNGYQDNEHHGDGIIIGGSDRDGYTGGNQTNGSAPVPEPTTMLLLSAGLIGVAGYGRKKLN
jgi:hypothetical protein